MIRYEGLTPGSDEPIETDLTLLGPGDAFGERALLRAEPRYATVRVIDEDLQVMSITRNG